MRFLGQKHSGKFEHTWVMCGTLVPTHDTSWSHGCSVSSRPPTVTASFSYGSDGAFRFWHSICLNAGHDAFRNEVSVQSLCVSQPQEPRGRITLAGRCVWLRAAGGAPCPATPSASARALPFPFKHLHRDARAHKHGTMWTHINFFPICY